jgi:Protein of unknown function (DUF3891)
MLLRADGDAVIAIGQASHAWLSGQLARAWGNATVGEVEHREATALAAEQHDVGMAQWDLAPALNPETGLPQSFMEMALETHLALWSAAPQRLFTQSRLAALLVSLHGTGLYERRDIARLAPEAADAVRVYLAGQRALQERLAAETTVGWDVLRRLQRRLAAWDWLSLALCLDWAPAALPGVPATGDDIELRLEPGPGVSVVRPWPFDADAVEVSCEGRLLRGRWTNAAELHAALERAPRVELRFELVPA